MNNTIVESLLKSKDYIFKKPLFKIVKDFKLSTNELILLIYFLNQDNPILNTEDIKNNTFLEDKEILESFTHLTEKGLLVIKMGKDKDGKVEEQIDLSNLYRSIISYLNDNIKTKTKISILEIFEKEFARPLSSMECEIITEWSKSGISEELIIGALKEAIFNGVSNLRYIDKILYEWDKKGFKTMDDVNGHLKKKNESNPKENSKVLFEYNWLDDEE